MSLTTNIKLNESIVPSIPFIWYREQELTCSIDYINILMFDKISKIYDLGNTDNLDKLIYIMIQRNISETDNLYICLHSLLYYELNKNNIKDDLLIIPNSFKVNLPFEVNTTMLNNTKIIELNGGLKMNGKVTGSVHIHDSSFSPPGCLHFKMDLNDEHSVLLCNIKCEIVKIDLDVLFVLFNNSDVDKVISELITKIDNIIV